ncbi:Chitin synthase 4 [Microsporum canis]|uniref:Protoplast regeneration and killer toxin resistance protein n=1 Tax=Arthroderma otae (strain ATCC MYA-4605 / CBS 113480) TaxID=554155 RepID=C5FGA5_ARTOC|nr:protoplast regeneration and killer toxin resistance protein [Microsporum canis CBS 113480]EEQ29790.1 protoplast regeneration and killer toxin resistance protein [Microsporum canis CBS 113480]
MGSQPPPLSPPLPVYLRSTPTRKPHPVLPPDGQDSSVVIHGGPVSPVRIDAGIPQPQPSSAEMGHTTNGQLHDTQESGRRTAEGRIDGDGDGPRTDSPDRQTADDRRESDESIEPYQPLQYHHQPFHEHVRSASASASISSRSSSNRNIHGDYLGIPHSSRRSPHTRAGSSHSHSDIRPLSFVDLLNVPYPQPPPAANAFSNAQLRSAVGNNASLLSQKQTFDMYLANVKKTNDPGAQYEFAVFMIHAAQDIDQAEAAEGNNNNNNNNSSSSSSSNNNNNNNPAKGEISRAELLREAKGILQRLSDRSYPYAQYYLADGLASGLFNKGKPDHDKAFQLFVAASKHGHAEAGYRAALCYEFGWGSKQDGAKAVQFYRQAASKNHPGAMARLGRACLAGDMGLVKRYREGLTWLKRAAESADVQYNAAPFELGLLHEAGYGDDVFQDESYAAQLFTKSAELGHAEASYRMGDAYEHGKLNCPRDPALSVHFYTGAAQLGHPMAMMALCAWFMVGAEPILEKDENESYEWARRAAECGLAKAEYAVGYFTEMGIGCRRDPLEANVWYVRAADHGDERAKHRIAAIRAAASGADPASAASRRLTKNGDKPKGKRFGLF